MTPADYEQIGRLYQAALEREPSKRAAFLAEACGTDDTLHRDVTSLLAAHEQATDFLERPPDDLAAGWQATAIPPQQRSFAHFQLLSPLGKGGMGEVWLAKDTRLGRRVALKLLPQEFMADAERVRRFAQEARAALALNHPNIITIHEIGETENTHYIVTEYVEGNTLRQRMDRSPLKLTEALDLAIQTGTALEAAHQAGIIHRDIKPENVMVRPDGYVKVLDFGLAKLLEPSTLSLEAGPATETRMNTETGLVMGTPRNMSPEQARGEKVDARTDIFSLGVVLYEMITGRAPFRGATRNDVIAAILKEEPPPLGKVVPEAPSDLQRIVTKALQKDRERRYQATTELVRDLKELKEGLAVADHGSGSTQSRSPFATARGPDLKRQTSVLPIRRPRAVVGTVAILAALVIAATGAWVYFRSLPKLTGQDTIVLADFDNRTGDDVFDTTLKHGLAIQLRQSPFLNLFSEGQVQQTLAQMNRPPGTRVTAQIAREICERHNLKAFIAGSIAPLGSHYAIAIEAINGHSGEVLTRELVEAKGKEEVLQALSQGTTRLRENLGESLNSIQRFDKPLEQATTSNLEAFRAWSLGVEYSYRGRVMEAIPFYKRAVDLDPDFAQAHSILSTIFWTTGRLELAAEHAKKGYVLKNRVNDYEQLRLTNFYHGFATGNLNKRIEVLILLKRMYPREHVGFTDLALTYDLLGQYDEAIPEAREAIRLIPNFAPSHRALGWALVRLNRFAEAKDALVQALQKKLDTTFFHSFLYEIAFIHGDTAGMQQQVDWASGKPDEYVALNWQSSAAAFTGEWRRAQELSRRAIDQAAQGDTKEVAAAYAAEQALRLAVLSSNFGLLSPENRKLKLELQTLVQSALNLARGRASLPRVALALAMCSQTDQAKPLIDELTKRYPEDTLINSIWLPVIRATIDLQRGNAAGAVEQLRTASRYEPAAEFWPQYLRGQVYLKLKQGTEAATEFQKILDHRGQAPLSVLYPLAHLGLARAAALAGDTAKSRASFEEFFKILKSADGDLRILDEAKTEYQRLSQLRKHRGG